MRRLRAAGCVFAEAEADLILSHSETAAEVLDLVQRRVDGDPLEYIVGWALFAGLHIVVEPGVFVPRRRTEFLAEQAVARAQSNSIVVDLCCGSGAVGAAMLATLGSIELYATDIDPAAVHCARRNIRRQNSVFEGDLLDALPVSLRGLVTVLTANAPYVPTEEISLMPPEARLHEAAIALDGGADGLDIQRRVAADAAKWLAPNGYVLVESSKRQAPMSAQIMERVGFSTRILFDDERESTVIVGQNPQ